MKYCPECNKQFTDTWITFCSEDGTLLIDELSPPVDPNWDPKIREPKFDSPSEQATQWLPRQPPVPGGWVAPDERPPMRPAWQPPPPPPAFMRSPSQGLAIASMITGVLGLLVGCFGPLPGIAALILGMVALSQMKKSPNTTAGKPLAIIGIVTGSLSILFYVVLFIWFILALAFGR
jgi:Domain of unknown function (DUF4190)